MMASPVTIPALAWLAGATIGAALINWGPAMLAKNASVNRLRACVKGKLAITFDDGPGPELTPPLLDMLARHRARCTFFLVGFRADQWPHTVDAIARDGIHELGCHTHWHRNAWKSWPWSAVRDIRHGYESLAPWISPSAPFRPPFGKLTTPTLLALRRRQASVCLWTHDGADTWPVLPDPDAHAEAILADGGGVVLLHSHDRGADRQKYVLRITDRLLTRAAQLGLRHGTMSEIISDSMAHVRSREA